MLSRGDLVPHFAVTPGDGEPFSYGSVWQQQNLVLITLPADEPSDRYVRDLKARDVEFRERNTCLVITRDAVDGLPAPGALLADRWGEIHYVVAASDLAELPTPAVLLEWLDYIRTRCPECEGEAR